MAICHILNTGETIMEEEVIPFAPRSWVAGSQVDTGSVDAAPRDCVRTVASRGGGLEHPLEHHPSLLPETGQLSGSKRFQAEKEGGAEWPPEAHERSRKMPGSSNTAKKSPNKSS